MDVSRSGRTAPSASGGATRRSVLALGAGSVAGAGVLGAGGAGLATAAGGVAAGAHAPQSAEAARAVVAYVSDAASGEITLMLGDREKVVVDRGLARLLTRLAV